MHEAQQQAIDRVFEILSEHFDHVVIAVGTYDEDKQYTTAASYTGVACSGDGGTMVAVATANPIYVSSQYSTTLGATGQLIGSRLAAVELQHVGSGVFIPISFVGNIKAK